MMRELSKADEVIRSAIESCNPRAWNEDHITYTWLSKLRAAAPKIPFFKRPGVSVIWDAYKMDGRLEEDNGDVAFLVKVTFNNSNTLTGVAFLEAKRIYSNGNYDALKWAQLRHMTDRSSHHHILLYDFQEQEILHPLPWGCCWDCPCDSFRSNKAIGIVVPTLHALAYEVKNRSLATIGYRLSEQIFFRYFRGLDLNFDQNLVENVKAGVAGGVQYLAVAHVNLSEEVDVELSLHGVRPNENSGFRRLDNNNESIG
jgi:hypothetical protein